MGKISSLQSRDSTLSGLSLCRPWRWGRRWRGREGAHLAPQEGLPKALRRPRRAGLLLAGEESLQRCGSAGNFATSKWKGRKKSPGNLSFRSISNLCNYVNALCSPPGFSTAAWQGRLGLLARLEGWRVGMESEKKALFKYFILLESFISAAFSKS